MTSHMSYLDTFNVSEGEGKDNIRFEIRAINLLEKTPHMQYFGTFGILLSRDKRGRIWDHRIILIKMNLTPYMG